MEQRELSFSRVICIFAFWRWYSGPGNAGWQRDLASLYNRVGNVQLAQGNLPAALTSYQASFAIMDRLAKSDSGNADWQRDLAASISKLGDVLIKEGKTADAIQKYRVCLDIMSRLAADSPANLQWRMDIIELNYDLAINGDLSIDRFAYVAKSLTKLKAEQELSGEQAGWLFRTAKGSFDHLVGA
jgi:tetratricopeptide (TPR) repeat protein